MVVKIGCKRDDETDKSENEDRYGFNSRKTVSPQTHHYDCAGDYAVKYCKIPLDEHYGCYRNAHPCHSFAIVYGGVVGDGQRQAVETV